MTFRLLLILGAPLVIAAICMRPVFGQPIEAKETHYKVITMLYKSLTK